MISNTQRVILIVDDQERNVELLKKLLRQEGYEIMSALNSDSALSSLKMRTPDLILMDVVMPGKNGFELCREVKATPEWRDIPVIFLSGDILESSIRAGFESGGVDYVRKPFKKEELLARVHTHIELRRIHLWRAEQLKERNRVLNLIANEWHRPLQRMAITIAQAKESCHALDTQLTAILAAEAAEAERMLASVEMFLQLRSVDVDSPESDPQEHFDSEMLKKMIGSWYTTAKRKPVELILQTPSSVVVLPPVAFMAKQIIDAVTTNAIEHTPAGERVLVQILSTKEGLAVQWQDTGPGFTPSYLSKPFRPQLRATSGKNRSNSSFGMGLAAAKRAADRIGAQLTLENRNEGGALVRVVFPILGDSSSSALAETSSTAVLL